MGFRLEVLVIRAESDNGDYDAFAYHCGKC